MRTLLLIPLLFAVTLPAAEQIQFSIMLGVGDSEPTAWNGSIRASGAKVVSMEIWRPEA
ncbi:MAG: hypothetical protein GY953_20265, partial [bacterium]|nr:hypothetical protein [bacterium]